MADRKNLAHDMFEHIARWQASGIAAADYAKQVGITYTKFKYWIGKFKKQEAENGSSLKFIDLGSFAQASKFSHGSEGSESTRCPQITLTLPSGLCLKIY